MAAIATGFFDGVHLGHRQVIQTLVSSAAEIGEEPIVVTFAQHPRAVLQLDARKLRLLTSSSEKTELLRSLGVEHIEVLPFTREFATMTAEEYISKILVERLGCSTLVLGYDTRLGSDMCTAEQLGQIARNMGLKVVSCPPVGLISSTKIRNLLDEGQVEVAAEMLGGCYALRGVVVPGKQLGRTIGFPTANLQVSEPLKLIPGKGVYLTSTEVLGREYDSMTNVGDIVETNIFDFDEDIYSLDICVRFKERLRDMKSFANVDELKSQLQKDERDCREKLLYLQKH